MFAVVRHQGVQLVQLVGERVGTDRYLSGHEISQAAGPLGFDARVVADHVLGVKGVAGVDRPELAVGMQVHPWVHHHGRLIARRSACASASRASAEHAKFWAGRCCVHGAVILGGRVGVGRGIVIRAVPVGGQAGQSFCPRRPGPVRPRHPRSVDCPCSHPFHARTLALNANNTAPNVSLCRRIRQDLPHKLTFACYRVTGSRPWPTGGATHRHR